MFEMLSAPTLEELKTKVDGFLKDRPNAMVEYGHIAIIADTAGYVPDMDEPTLGSIVAFTEYPDIRWEVQHIDGDYVYLATESVLYKCPFGRDNVADIKYSESTLYAHCMTYLNGVIPNVADYLEDVTVNGVTAKVFVPSYEQMISEWDWPSSDSIHRTCTYEGSLTSYWTSSPVDFRSVRFVSDYGNFNRDYPMYTYGFRPAVKLNLKNYLKTHPDGLLVGV